MIRGHRLGFSAILSLIFFIFVTARLGYLQLYCHAALQERANREHTRTFADKDPRGGILDRTGSPLAMSIQGGACFADPKRIKNIDDTAKALSPFLHESTAVIRSKLSQKRRFVWLARRLDPETAQAIQQLKKPGISVVTEMKRFYPEETLAAHVLGVVGDTQAGLSGVELIVDSWLSGRSVPALFKAWTFKSGTQTFQNVKSDLAPRSIVLTIDRNLQTIAEQELAVQMKISRPKSGTVIIQDPHTGEILAMASAPAFNANLWGSPQHPDDYGPDTLKNPAVEKVIEPGSTFKIVAAAAALEDQQVRPTDTFFCENGNWQIPGRVIHDHEPEGWLTFAQVISHSSNIGTAKVAQKLGDERLYRFARAFGFGMPTSCGLPGDGTGILRQTKQWHSSSLETISFGQEVGVTPLQMVNAYSVIANGGWLMEPRLYRGVIDEHGDYHEWEAPAPIRRVISNRTVTQMRAILKQVVDEGTGKAAQVTGMTVAGKTGTAQKIDPHTRQYSDSHYIASFCGFAPAEQPKVVIGVFLDEPQTNYWGGSEAAPLFSRILKHAAPYLRIPSGEVGPLAASRMITRS